MISKNGVGLVVMILSLFGVTVAEAEIVTTISVLGQVISVVLMLWNQITRRDVKNLIFKK